MSLIELPVFFNTGTGVLAKYTTKADALFARPGKVASLARKGTGSVRLLEQLSKIPEMDLIMQVEHLDHFH